MSAGSESLIAPMSASFPSRHTEDVRFVILIRWLLLSMIKLEPVAKWEKQFYGIQMSCLKLVILTFSNIENKLKYLWFVILNIF